MKLISMTEFVLHKNRFKEDSDTAVFKITNYANFLKQPLKIQMFIPCDLDNNILEEPTNYQAFLNNLSIQDFKYNILDCSTYKRAKDRVLFEGFEYLRHQEYWFDISTRIDDFYQEITLVTDETVEDLLTNLVDFDWNLTEYAKNQIGL